LSENILDLDGLPPVPGGFKKGRQRVRVTLGKSEIARLINLRGFTIKYLAHELGISPVYLEAIAYHTRCGGPEVAEKLFDYLMLDRRDRARFMYQMCQFEQRLCRLVGWTLRHWKVEPEDLARSLWNVRADMVANLTQSYLTNIVGSDRLAYKRYSNRKQRKGMQLRHEERREYSQDQNIKELYRVLAGIIESACIDRVADLNDLAGESLQRARVALYEYFVSVHRLTGHKQFVRDCRRPTCREAMRLCGVVRKAPTPPPPQPDQKA